MKMKRIHSILALLSLTCCSSQLSADQSQPNILWLTAEDHGPHLGCYGDTYATTPQIDALASRSLLYTHASSTAPVCAAARTTLITGMYAPSLGGQHMRSRVAGPEWLTFYPALLRQAGYYCTNNSKEDYNISVEEKGWDESSKKAHWKNRSEDQPFFAVFNVTNSHESQIRNKNKNPVHDPAKAPLPPYHPDTPEVRKDWAQYYDRLTEVDQFVKKHLDDLAKAGLAEETIVFFYADHGSGMPRGKRYAGWSGLHVPMIVHVPKKYQHLAPSNYRAGGKSDRLVGFVDLAPTVLSLAGVKPPEWQQGGAFLGKYQSDAPQYSYGFRGRMDERPDVSRSVMDGQYIYIRNYLPFLPHGQSLNYQMQTPTTRVWHEMFQQGSLNDVQSAFWKPHPAEELFDLNKDPHETHNLAHDPNHKAKLLELRHAHEQQLIKTHDLALMPEREMHHLANKYQITPAEVARKHYNPENLLKHTSLQYLTPREAQKELDANTKSDVSRLECYWDKVYLMTLPKAQIRKHRDYLSRVFPNDLISSELLVHSSETEQERESALDALVKLADVSSQDVYTCIDAYNALDRLKPLPKSVLEALAKQSGKNDNFGWKYVDRLRQNLGLSTPKKLNKNKAKQSATRKK